MIPYGRQLIDEKDIEAVTEVLRSDWLTTGPHVEEFEKGLAEFVDATHAVAVCNGTAALHVALYAAGIGQGDEVIVPAMTFAATSNAVLYQQGIPVFADVLPETLLIDPRSVESKVTPKTKAIIAVDYAGQPCDYDELRKIANRHGLVLIADACHALGAVYRGKKVGAIADLTAFSFHPVKHITTGEGGMVTTNNPDYARRAKLFRNHGISTDFRERETKGTWAYEMVDLGYNYRITDIQCALGKSQLTKLPAWLERRNAIARQYNRFFGENTPGIVPLAKDGDVFHAYHLYVVQVDASKFGMTRDEAFRRLRASGIGVNIHYIPVYLHPYYRDRLGTAPGLCPVAEAAYERILSLPMFQAMTDAQADQVYQSILSL